MIMMGPLDAKLVSTCTVLEYKSGYFLSYLVSAQASKQMELGQLNPMNSKGDQYSVQLRFFMMTIIICIHTCTPRDIFQIGLTHTLLRRKQPRSWGGGGGQR